MGLAAVEDLDLVDGDHVVHFYRHDDGLAEGVGGYLAGALGAGDAVVVIAGEDHRRGFARAMGADGIDLAAARSSGRLVELDAADMLAGFDDGTSLDPVAFDRLVGGAVRTAARAGRRVHAYGEMVALLWEAGHLVRAIELEELWNDLARRTPFSLVCAYPDGALAGDEAGFARICHVHSAVVGPGPDGQVTRRFAASLDSPASARRFATEVVTDWGRPELVHDVAMVVSELATNAVVHGRSDFTLILCRQGATVRIAVRDRCTDPPVPRPSPPEGGGRGLVLVGAIADRWGQEPTTGAKVVWAELGGTG